MLAAPRIPTISPLGDRLRGLLSLMNLALAAIALAATFFLMSPPTDAGYPGAIAWGENSLLKRVIDVMSLGGAVRTVRGTEIKDFAFHIAVVVALSLLAMRALVSGLAPPKRRTAKGAWFIGQASLAAWVGLSLASSTWAGDPQLARGQAALYGLALAWAVAIAWGLESRDVPRLLRTYVAIAASGAALCIWHYYTRNPFHRPGFPIGNPGTLAACLLPAILIVGAVAAEAIWSAGWNQRPLATGRLAAALVAFVPLCWCFVLAGSRSAFVGLFAGVGGLLFLLARRRTRMVVTGVMLLAIALGGWYFSSTKQDRAMARGATIRFRMYAWRYAAGLWSQQPITGVGAGQYPRLANALSVGDRILDPAAFMAELVEHAHNELFEVFAEIGLAGAVTYVAGFLATLAAASALLRGGWSSQRRWLLFGLVAGVIGLMADAMFGVGLRLSAVPVVFYTLIGALWAMCRSVSKLPENETPQYGPWLRHRLVRRYGLAGASLIAAIVAGWLTARDWTGVEQEFAAWRAESDGEYAAAAPAARVAGELLLDPVRVLISRKRVVDCEFARAHESFVKFATNAEPSSDDAQQLWNRAVDQVSRALEEALQFRGRAPNIGRMESISAQCCEMLAVLHERGGDANAAIQWRQRALRDWQMQRALRPFDSRTLLNLARYLRPFPPLVGEYIGLLRDDLRNGFPSAEWRAALRDAKNIENFGRRLEEMRRAVGPYDPQTDLDALVLSLAPEMCRIAAAWSALNGEYEKAADDAATAAKLYRSMRGRFPELYSVARAEQAEYVFEAHPDDRGKAIPVIRDAIAALPPIQKQKYDTMAIPYRLTLARFLLSTDQRPEAAGLIRDVLQADPRNMIAWSWTIRLAAEAGDADVVRKALSDASEAGLGEAELKALRESVRQYLPEALDELD